MVLGCQLELNHDNTSVVLVLLLLTALAGGHLGLFWFQVVTAHRSFNCTERLQLQELPVNGCSGLFQLQVISAAVPRQLDTAAPAQTLQLLDALFN